MSDENDFGNFVSGFVVGGLIGAAMALLLAPQSGEETRTVIREKGIELRDRAAVTAEEARLRAEKALEDARLRADQAAEEVRLRADELSRLISERASELQQRGQSVLDGQKSRPVAPASEPPPAEPAAE